MRRWLPRASRWFLLFVALSFLGWVAETLFFFAGYGRLCDRGFLALPLCTIYGFSFLALYALVGVPGQVGGGLLWGRRKKSPSLWAYVLLAALVPTALELVTGVFFHRAFGLRLWSYEGYPCQFHGYICLPFTLLWAFLLPLCMRYLFLPLKRWVFALPDRWAWGLSGALALLTAGDWLINILRQGG